MTNPVSQVFRFILKLVLGLFAAVLALSLLTATLMVLAFSLLKSLVTGRKSAPAMVFGHFQRFSAQTMRPGRRASQGPAKAASGQIVDVEVREIPDDRRHS